MPKQTSKASSSKAQALTAEAAVREAQQNPVAFLALALGFAPSDLQRELLLHALQHEEWYAELPRGHAKTSTLCYLTAWWLGVRPDTRFKIVSQNDEAAGATTRFIRDIVRGAAFKATFPHVQLKAGEDTITSWSVNAKGLLPRSKDPSVQGSGVFGRTGGRADVIWFDDICDLRNSVLQPTLRGQVKEAIANIWLPMLDPAAQHASRVWKTATPFHTDDATADWRRLHGGNGSLLRRPCQGDYSPWPDVFTPEILAARRNEMGAMAYARAYELVPLSSDLLVFRPEWFQYYKPDTIPVSTRTVAAVDWGYGKKAQDRDDPDYSVCIVGEIDSQRRLYLTDILRVRESFPTFANMAAALLHRRGASVVLAEANGPQRGIFDQFAQLTKQPMVAVERTTDKHMRAAGVQPFVQGLKLHFPCDYEGRVTGAFSPVVDELLSFPAGAHDDTVDCIVDLCGEAVRGSLSSADLKVNRIDKPDAITKMFGATKAKRPFFS
jgi:predicted phage terminase large subunit-like protein